MLTSDELASLKQIDDMIRKMYGISDGINITGENDPLKWKMKLTMPDLTEAVKLGDTIRFSVGAITLVCEIVEVDYTEKTAVITPTGEFYDHRTKDTRNIHPITQDDQRRKESSN